MFFAKSSTLFKSYFQKKKNNFVLKYSVEKVKFFQLLSKFDEETVTELNF